MAVDTTVPPAPSAHLVSFEGQIRPILEARCSPCHFEGGVMYRRLPFDRPQTIRHLGTKLFTRIMNEGEQGVVSLFLAQSPEFDNPAPSWFQTPGNP
jgi:hypothetical protein